jgi:hypothetical protein
MKVLLLGVTGNVGSRALPALIKHGHTVVAYVRSINKVTPAARNVLADVVIGSATDKQAIKNAIITHNCDAVFSAAGVAQMFGHSKTGEFNTIFATVVSAIVEARQERRGAPIRAWLMAGFPIMDSLNPPHVIGDYLPIFPEHHKNLAVIRKTAEEDIAWSLFCASDLKPKHAEIVFPVPDDCSSSNVVAKADSPPEWRNTLNWLPLIGPYLNIMVQAAGYNNTLEDPLDFIASDLEKALQSEFVGKRVAFKMKQKAQ